MTILSLRHLFLSAVTPPHRAEVWRGIGPPLHVGPTLAPVTVLSLRSIRFPEPLNLRDMGQCGPVRKCFLLWGYETPYMLIWAELWHGKIAGMATSHGDRKIRTRNENEVKSEFEGGIGVLFNSWARTIFEFQNTFWFIILRYLSREAWYLKRQNVDYPICVIPSL